MGRSGPECRWWRGRRAHPAASRAQVRMEGCGGEWFGVPVPRLFLFVGALHPIRRQCTSSVRVHRHVTGAPPRNGCSAPVLVAVVAAVGSSVLELSSAWVVFRAWGVFCLGLCGASCCGSSEMSHAIPRHVFQTLKSHRWNCNVLGCCTKFGYPNCVRVLVDEAPEASSCVRSSSHDTVHNPRDASNTTPTPQNAKSRLSGSSHFGVWGWCWHGVGACPMIEVATLQTLGGPDMGNGTFSALDMTTYCGLVELGLVAVGMRCQEGGFVLKCRAANPARLCPGCGRPGDALGSRTRRLAHEPRGHQPTMLVVYVGRYRCRACSRSWCDDISQAAPPRAKLSFGALRWGLVCLIADNMSINRIAAHLAVAWHTANEAILAYGEELLLADSTRFEGVRVIGVDEHVWRHRGGDRYATVIVDLTPVRDHTGPARLLDVVQGRSKHVLSSWLAACPQEWKDNIEIVAMDGFSGYKSAAASQLPGAVTVMDPFHVVHIAIDALEQCRQRVQQETLGHRGRKGDPLYAARKTLLTGTDILTDTSQARLDAVFACPDHADVHATWRIYQDLLAAYRDRDPRRGKNTLRQLITTLTRPGLPHTCIELARMGRTFTRRAGDILAYFDHPHTSNGPTEAINGRLEHLRGIAQGFVNHRNYRLRCLLHSGGFQHLLHP